MSVAKLPPKLNLNSLGIFLIRVYQNIFSVFFGGNCKFYPSCSNYALESFEKHNFLNASKLTALRLSKCHPFSTASGIDLVPESNNGK
jgi:hypothetical protein